MAKINYEKITWENDVTPVNATNMNHIEGGLKDCVEAINEAGGKAVVVPQATSSVLGGIKASTRDSTKDINEVKINAASGVLFTQMEKLQVYTQEQQTALTHNITFNASGNPIYKKTGLADQLLITETTLPKAKLLPQEQLASDGTSLSANKSYYITLGADKTNLTLDGGETDKLNHWHLVVTNSGGAYTTSFNTTIKWSGALPSFANNKTYEFSIIRVGTSPSFTYLGSWVEY